MKAKKEKLTWPRLVARKHLRLKDAIQKLQGDMDEHNRDYALEEFIDERERIARSHGLRDISKKLDILIATKSTQLTNSATI